MIQGTMSNAGKSLLVAGLCRIFKQDGYRVAPFKSQNMALNSYITREGLEMGRAQVMQAEAAGIDPLVCMNPILLKPTNDTGSQVIVNGEVLGNMRARDYFSYKKELIPQIMTAYRQLEEQADIIVIEGAGSPAEINLKENDIVNMGLAKMVNAPVLLVGDIDRGGVFAQLLGTMMLLEKEEQNRVKGLIINKFRGDKTILDPGITMLEERSQVPVVGVVPYMDISLEDEDSLTERFTKRQVEAIDIAVIHYPRISNFTDFDVFEQMEGVSLRYVNTPRELYSPDLILLPGSKNTMGDLKWMRETGMEAAVKKRVDKSVIFGICGGYQMLGMRISDPQQVEEGGILRGMELLPVETVLTQQKIRTQVTGQFQKVTGILSNLSDSKVAGYEIHMGVTSAQEEPGKVSPMGAQEEPGKVSPIGAQEALGMLRLTDAVTGLGKTEGCVQREGQGAGTFQNLLVICMEKSIYRCKNFIFIGFFLHFILSHMLRITSKNNIRTPTRHVSSYSNRPKSTCLCNYFRFPIVLLCI